MSSLILCEGLTDAAFLSCYLERVSGWKYSGKSPENLDIKEKEHNESVEWYQKDDENLLICGVGGKDNLGSFFNSRIYPPLVRVNAFGKIVFITDRDDRTVDEIEKALVESVEGCITSLCDREWRSNVYVDGYGLEHCVDVLLLVIPKAYAGALESIMLESIAEDPYDKNIVDKAAVFAQQMRFEADKYIKSSRLQLKAQLGITWAVQSPDRTFKTISQRIKSVQWEKYDVLRECFAMLSDI